MVHSGVPDARDMMTELQGTESLELILNLKKANLLLSTRASVDRPQIPQDITGIDDDGLMELWARVSAYSDFVATQVACAQIDEKYAENNLELEIAKLEISMPKEVKETAAYRKAKILTSPTIEGLQNTLLARHAYRKLIEVISSSLSKDSALLSRELTRRTSSGGFSARTRTLVP